MTSVRFTALVFSLFVSCLGFAASSAASSDDELDDPNCISALRPATVETHVQQKYHTLMDQAAEAILVVDAQGKITDANTRALQWFGYDAGGLVGQSIEILVPERFRKEYRERHRKFLEKPEARSLGAAGGFWARRKDGSEFPIDISLSPFETSDGLLVHVAVRDNSERRTSKQRLKAMAESVPAIAHTMDLEKRVTGLAKAYVPIFSDWCVVYLFENGQMVPHAVFHRDATLTDTLKIAAEYGPLRIRYLKETEIIKVERNVNLAAISLNAKHLSALQALRVKSLVHAPMLMNGKLIGLFTFGIQQGAREFSESDKYVFSDLAVFGALAVENARLYQESLEAVRGREQILSVVSHDLRSPLTSIALNAQFIEKFLASTPEARSPTIEKRLFAIRSSSAHMSRLIDELLDFSTVETGHFSLNLELADIDVSIENTIEFMNSIAQEKGIEITKEIPDDMPRVLMDSRRIEQVISNLLGNAIKFSPKEGKVAVRLRTENNELLVSISDNRPGVARSDLPHLFDPFWQAKGTEKMGMGLALYIASRIIKAHHGSIWVEDGTGKGLSVYFTIPLSQGGVER